MEDEDPRLAVSRHAARLFLEHGVAGTSGDDIAAAAGLSKRTVWRYFRTKENCVEPLFSATALRFAATLRRWPRNMSIEDYFQACLGPDHATPEELSDGLLAVRLIARLPDEPALRAAWLMSCQISEEALAKVIGERLHRSAEDFEVRLCAATVIAAVRVVDETVSTAAIKHGQKFTLEEINSMLARSVRAASTLPISDPVAS
nr:helix-turn-helix domain-containing protein [uncultured Roseococcus sp.]